MTSSRPPVTAVFFDVGETLIDETTMWHSWADWLGVPRHTLSAVFGAALRQDLKFLEVFRRFRPDFDLPTELKLRAAAGVTEDFGEADLYPDARDCLTDLRAAGYFVAIAGNQPARAEHWLRELELPVDLIATSGGWHAAKPDPAFFAKVVEAADRPPAEILYVGDRIDNDVRPAAAAGLRTAFVRRGPWGYIDPDPDALRLADLRLDSLADLLARLPEL